MTVYWKYNKNILMKSTSKNVIDETWNFIEADNIDDIIPDGQGGVRIKTLEEKIAEEKARKLQELKQRYAQAAAATDARILQYQKRKELGILDEDDEEDYQEALELYKTLTEQYRQKKAEIESLNDLEALRNYDTTIAK